jgi:hypothetical protein
MYVYIWPRSGCISGFFYIREQHWFEPRLRINTPQERKVVGISANFVEITPNPSPAKVPSEEKYSEINKTVK